MRPVGDFTGNDGVDARLLKSARAISTSQVRAMLDGWGRGARMQAVLSSLWLETPIGRMMSIGGVIILIAAPIVIYFSWQNDSEWTSYRNEHHCMPFAREAVLTPKGIVPGKLGWVCDDGSTHWRDY